MDMVIKSNWGNCKSKSITEDLMNMHKQIATNTPKKFIPTYPAWVKNYADKFGLVEGKDFIVPESYAEAE